MKFDPKHLIAIEIVRREASLTRAADVLGTSQPALSRTLSDLEIRIGAPIFDRRSRPWSLTRNWAKGWPARVPRSCARRNAHSRNSTSFTAGGKDKLRLAGPPFFTDGAVTNWLSRFRRRHPDVAFELSYGYGEELEDAVTSGRADVAIYPVGIGDLPPDLVFTPLIEATNVIVCRRASDPETRLSASPRAFGLWLGEPAAGQPAGRGHGGDPARRWTCMRPRS
jgi:DNA-binding transcriptional LysR family regulator